MKRLLVLFAKGFPYSINEPFLENEYALYKDYFDKVLIATCCGRGEEPTRKITDPTIEVLPDYTLSKDLRSIIEAIPYVLTDGMFYRELKHLIFTEGFTFRKLYDLMTVSFCANHRVMQVTRWLKQHPEYEVSIIYSYWMHITALSAVRLKQKLKGKTCKAVTRTHRFDLYSEESKTGYLPFHKQLYHALDEIASISDDGKQYLEKKYGAEDKISIHHLGALDRGIHNPESPRKPFKIVSCARTVPFKRIDKIVDALAQIKDHDIHWTHIGGGASQEYVEQYAAEKLPENVKVTFTRMIPNTQVYEIYGKESFHVFVNVSESEGVPVSIMEAMSFHIPVIATAVGGTPELINEGRSGYLLEKDYRDQELVDSIRRLIEMPEEAYLAFRADARDKFERDYNAIPNYRKFIEHLAEISQN